MINLMYLVLTALLALNVSAEILRAFMLVNRSLQKTSEIIIDKNEIIYKQFEKKMSEDPTKTKPFYDKAQFAKKYCGEVYQKFQENKAVLIDEGGDQSGKVDKGDFMDTPGEEDRLKGEANLETSSMVLLVEKNGKRAKELRDAVKNTRDKLLQLVENKDDKDRLTKTLPLAEPTDPPKKDGIQKTWQESLFGEIPLAAAVTLISKFESDIKSSESEIINYLLNQISATDFKFDQLEAKVIANTNYVMIGQEYKAEIFVSAFSSTQNPQVLLGTLDEGGNLLQMRDSVPVQNGKGMYVVRPSSEGEQKYSGVVRIRRPGGDFEDYAFNSSYQVAKGSFVVSPEKMNVLYIAIENPIAVSVPGFPAEKVKASISQGSLTGGKGKYMAMPTTPGKAGVTVTVEINEDGKTTSKVMGTQEFRVKRVPDPVPMIGGQEGGQMKAGTFKAQTGLQAVLKDFDFEGVRYAVVEFEMSYIAKRQDLVSSKTQGALFDSRMQEFLSRAKPGDIFIMENIKAVGPDKLPRKLPSITFKLI